MDEAPETSHKSLIEHRIRIIMEMADGMSEEELSELLRGNGNEMDPPSDLDSRVQETILELITAESKYKEKISQLEEKIKMLSKNPINVHRLE